MHPDSNIIQLELGQNNISSSGFTHLFKSLMNNQTLVHLDIGNNGT